MTRETVFSNARIVLGDRVMHGTVQVRDGRIAALATGGTMLPGAIDLEGDFLLPGLVELHTDNLEKHFSPRPGVQWPSQPAAHSHDAQIASAGITTTLDAIAIGDLHARPERAERLAEAVRAIERGVEDGTLRAEHHLHLRCEICCADVIEMLDGFAAHPLVKLVSLMDHTPGQRQFVNIDKFRTYYMGRYGYSAAEMDDFIERRTADQRRYGEAHRAAIVGICRERGHTIASHDDATRAHVEEAAASGAVISEFPTTIEAAAASHEHGLAVLMGAPNLVLGGSHSGNVSAMRLASEGLLDILSSDYVPSSLLQGVFLLHREGMNLPDAVAKASRNPARMVGLDDRGEIAEGKRADLLRVRETPHGPIVRTVWREGQRII